MSSAEFDRGQAAILDKLDQAMDEACDKAWAALAKYKFWMFGYYAARWVTLNKLRGERRPNPWAGLVRYAAGEVATHAKESKR